MQGPTHIMAGIILRRTFDWKYFKGIGIAITIISALLLHGIFDKLGRSTYHPVDMNFTDPFWLIYHVIMWLTSLVMLYMFWSEYKIGIVFSLLPDIDWIVLHTAGAFHKEIIFYKTPLIHDALNFFIDNVIPFSYLNSLPDLRIYPWACVFEILLFAAMVLIYRAQISRRRNIHF